MQQNIADFYVWLVWYVYCKLASPLKLLAANHHVSEKILSPSLAAVINIPTCVLCKKYFQNSSPVVSKVQT